MELGTCLIFLSFAEFFKNEAKDRGRCQSIILSISVSSKVVLPLNQYGDNPINVTL